MNSVSRFLIVAAILFLFLALCYKPNTNQDSIRAELAAKGLPTPAFANAEQLRNILKMSSTLG